MKPRHLLLALLLASIAPARAHRLDEYLQSTTIRLATDRIALHVRLVPGIDVAGQVWGIVDSDGNGELSPSEQRAYAARVLNDLSLSIDGRKAELAIVNSSYPAQADVVRGAGQISLSLEADLAGAPGFHRLRFVSRHRPVPSVYLVNTLLPVDGALHIDGQRRSADQSEYELDFDVPAPTSQQAHGEEGPRRMDGSQAADKR